MRVAACIDWLLLAMGTQLFAHWSDDRNTRVALLTSLCTFCPMQPRATISWAGAVAFFHAILSWPVDSMCLVKGSRGEPRCV